MIPVDDSVRPDRQIGTDRLNVVSESVIREMTREAHRHDAINLSQGIPDVDEAPVAIKKAAKTAIDTESQYTITWGLPDLREAVSERYADWKGIEYNPETEVTVTIGTSEAVVSCHPFLGIPPAVSPDPSQRVAHQRPDHLT